MSKPLDNAPAKWEAGLAVMNALKPLKNANPQEVLARYLGEESTQQIADSYGVTRSGLNYWMLRVAEDEWKDAQVVRALKRKEKAEDELESATDGLTLARARELLKSAQWDLERVCKRIYGQETTQINVNGDGIKIELVTFRGDGATE